MDDSLTKRELELFGRLDSALPGLGVVVEDGSGGKLHFHMDNARVSIDRSRIASAAEEIDELSGEVELQLRKRQGLR